MAHPDHPAYRDKHPCTACGTGYLDCAEGWIISIACCKGCDHPTRWTTTPPYTDDEMTDMWQSATRQSTGIYRTTHADG